MCLKRELIHVLMLTGNRRFKYQSELDLFKALQRFSKLPIGALSQYTDISPSTIRSILNRVDYADFCHIGMVPKLEKFPEIPMIFLGFLNVAPERLNTLRQNYTTHENIMWFAHSEQKLFLLVLGKNWSAIEQLKTELTTTLNTKPIFDLPAPTIDKLNLTIPEEILDYLYARLTERRFLGNH